MNWAKKLLMAGDCLRCGGRLEDLGDGQVSCDTCSYPEPEDGFDEGGTPIEVDEPTCDVCGKILDSDHPTCPCCATALCGSKECYDAHMAEHYREWRGEVEDNEDDRLKCDYCGRDIDPDANWMLDTRDGTEHFCCAECQHERAAEIEAAPLCTWCHEKCDQGVVNSVRSPDNSAPFCSTECLKQYRKSTAHGVAVHVCAHCGKPIDGPRYISSRYPGLKFCSERCRDDYVSKQFREGYAALHG